MKAYYTKDYGGPEASEFGDFPDPQAAPGQLLVEVKAVSLNPVDFKKKRGDVRMFAFSEFPRIFGSDFAGVVKETTAGVSGFKKGDRVYGTIRGATKAQGSLAELVAVDQSIVRKIPEGISFEEAASLPIAALTALAGVRNCRVSKGDEVLINGATGGVGHFAVQIAKARGATVMATCRPENAELARKLGADETSGYHREDLEEISKKFDAIIDAYGRMDKEIALKLIKRGGTYATTLPGPTSLPGQYSTQIINGVKLEDANVRTFPEDYAEIENLVLEKKVVPVIENYFTLEKAADAFRLAEFGKPRGKIIVRIP